MTKPEQPNNQLYDNTSLSKEAPVHNRLVAVMTHVPWYCFCGQARLAKDARVSRAALSRLIAGRTRPSFHLVWALSRALERRLGFSLDPRELVSFDGTYPTPSACTLTGCRGCLPEWAYDNTGNLLPAFQGQTPGLWSLTEEEWHVTQENQHLPPDLSVIGAIPGLQLSADRRRGGKWGRG